MKLQILRKVAASASLPLGGSLWVDVIQFDVERRHEVEDAAASLARATGENCMRVVDEDETVRCLNDQGVFR
jgi:hypothetical protein